jgi:serine/threonine protein kinase
MSLTDGSLLGHYEIVAPLGAGGMGEVYEARDTKLKRTVVVKVLPAAVAADPERRLRFQREAEAVAALNHPNIVTIHAVDEVGGVPFIAMERVDGQALAQLIPPEGLPVTRLLALAIPLTDAVSAAHQRGILHRDLKPSNVMVNAEGRVKVLDFGLAKLTEGTAATAGVTNLPTDKLTGDGRILGTVAYMSPEQAEGRAVDHRSDLFSLGVVLYEMATGDRPFKGDSAISVISSILKDKPRAITEVRGGIPQELWRIVRRCLEKDPARRIQTALDLKNELEDLQADLSSPASSTSVTLPMSPTLARSRRWPWAAVAAVAVVAATVAVVNRPAPVPPAESVPTLVKPVQLTSAIGLEDFPTWSPDGTMLAYAAAPDGATNLQTGQWDIWIVPANGGPSVNRTADHPGIDAYPSWSPDGQQIAFYSDRAGGGYYVMPAIGGAPRRVLSAPSGPGRGPAYGAPRWLKGGAELACTTPGTAAGSTDIAFISLTTLDLRTISIPESRYMYDAAWSPDGGAVAYAVAFSRSSEVTRLWITRVSDGRRVELSGGMSAAWSPEWSPDGRVVTYVSNRGGPMDVWQQRLTAEGTPDGPPHAVTTGIGIRRSTFSADRTKLAYSRGQTLANVWRVPILADRPAVWGDAEQLTFDQAFIEFVDVSLDGRRLLVSSNRSGNQDLWLMPIGGGEPTQVTRDPAPEWAPRFSPDEREAVFYGYRSGGRELWVTATDGGPTRQLTQTQGGGGFPDWPRVGNTILFTRRDSLFARGCLAAVDKAGGEPRCLTTEATDMFYPAGSPDGRLVVFNANRDGTSRLYVKEPRLDAAERPITRSGQIAILPRWAVDGRSIFFRRLTAGIPNLWSVTADGQLERQMTNLVGRRGVLGATALATDGRYLYFTWQEETGDLWTMNVASAKP